jgi:type II secretion system protein N
MEPIKRKRWKILRPLGYIVLALVVFVLSLWWIFPYDEAARGLEAKLAARGLEVKIEHLHPGFLLTLDADSIHVSRWQDEPLDITLGPTSVSPLLSPLFSGKLGVSVETQSFGGIGNARVELPNPQSVDIQWKDLDLSKILPVVAPQIPSPQGRSDGSITLGMPATNLTRLRGTMNAEFRQLAFGPGAIGGFPAPHIALGSGPVQMEALNGRIRVTNTKFSGGDLDISLDGNMILAAPVQRSALDATVTLRPSAKSEGELGLLFGLLAPTKSPDGSFTAKLKGTLSSPYVQSR